MKQSSAVVDTLAQRIIEHERTRADDPWLALKASFERLEHVLSELIGADGYRALTLRARDLTNRDYPWLDTLQAELPAQFPGDGWAALATQLGAATVEAAARALFANVLQLCCEFIGEELTFRFIARAWVLR